MILMLYKICHNISNINPAAILYIEMYNTVVTHFMYFSKLLNETFSIYSFALFVFYIYLYIHILMHLPVCAYFFSNF